MVSNGDKQPLMLMLFMLFLVGFAGFSALSFNASSPIQPDPIATYGTSGQ